MPFAIIFFVGFSRLQYMPVQCFANKEEKNIARKALIDTLEVETEAETKH